MGMTTEELKKYVAADIKKYNGARRPIKAGLVERFFVSNLPPRKLHPNPEDEFTWQNVGPSDAIVSNYMKSLGYKKNFREPITIEKMFPDGFTIINGHHRWAAAMRLGRKMLWVKIVNLTHEEDILRMIDSSKRTMRAAFDLDEVLFVTKEGMEAEPKPKFPRRIFCRKKIRAGVPALFKELHRLGFDVWIYTRTTDSEEKIRRMFKAYGEEPDGYINGITWSKKHGAFKSVQRFNGKYTLTVHIDNVGMIFTKPHTKEFESVDLKAENYDWALQAIKTIRERCTVSEGE